MRQRYLLGKYDRKKYIEDHKLLSENFSPEEIYIQSTLVNRTIQSAYSQFSGFFKGSPSQAVKQIKKSMSLDQLDDDFDDYNLTSLSQN